MLHAPQVAWICLADCLSHLDRIVWIVIYFFQHIIKNVLPRSSEKHFWPTLCTHSLYLISTSLINLVHYILCLQEWRCFQVCMVFPLLSGKCIDLVEYLLSVFTKRCLVNLVFSLLQVHIGFVIFAAVAPPVVFKGKSLA